MHHDTKPGALRRRISGALAALGVLTLSSGLALVVTASPAGAANKVGVCHATSSDTQPYTWDSVDDDSVKLKGHLAHRATPNKTWKNAGVFNGVPHAAGAPKPDLIGSFTDDQGVFQAMDGTITEADCASVSLEATADVDWIEPSCANKNTPDYTTSGTHVSFALTSGTVAPGQLVEVTATADPGSTFDGGGTTQKFTHTFDPAVDLNAAPCATADAVASVVFTDPSCANANAIGYVPNGTNVSFSESGPPTPGQQIQVTATATAGHTFGDLTTKKVFTHTFDPEVDLDSPPCKIVLPPALDATATVDFDDASCAAPTAAGYTTGGNHVTFSLTGTAAPGQDVVVTATADADHLFGDSTTVKAFPHHFPDAVDPDGCVVVDPPVDGGTPIVDTPALVHAGLTDTLPGTDLRHTQGLLLTAGGLVLLVVAAGLGLVRPGGRSRS